MNVIERTFAKLALKRMEAKMPFVKRWIPFGASVLVVAALILKAIGYPEAGSAILSVLTILPGVDTVDQAQATAAVTSGVGLVLQLVSRFNKARG